MAYITQTQAEWEAECERIEAGVLTIRIDRIRADLKALTVDAMESRCPLALVDRLADAERGLDAIKGFMEGGRRGDPH